MITDSQFLLANARIVDFPIVYCNDGLCQLTGFERADLMQRSATCSMMHGELTNEDSVRRLQDALEHHVSDQLEILFYKKNSACYIYLFI